ncbi:MAG: aminotransferase class I/II-fold pyridoxal phosphate-dependent enzyme [Oscillospiraceae bacterium]|nr:aminotransferase class I/II-fold pyridoxal phosphate-dependent enzyme [Oscillospiraceae bacterium]
MEFNTSLLHITDTDENGNGSTLSPICQVSAFAYDSAEQLEKVFNNRAHGYSYTRVGNPTVAAFEKRMAAIEGGIGAAACSSGMAAITAALLNILRAGDEVIVSSGLFGGTIELFEDLAPFGIKAVFLEELTYENIIAAVNENTKAVFTELIGNPRLDVVDIESVSDACREKGLPLIIDSTTATPYLIHPLAHGADIVIHSSSKYINGGGNSISGIIIDGGTFKWDRDRYPDMAPFLKYGPFAYLSKLRNRIWRNTGCCLSPFNAYMNMVGMETLGLRMDRCCSNALKLAEILEETEGIKVNYPGLKSSPYHEQVERQMQGRGGAIVTIGAGSRERAYKLINSLKYASIATNIGDVRTLVIHPASTIYTHSTEAQRQSAGVYEDTIRISVGIEDINDLADDFRQAVAHL